MMRILLNIIFLSLLLHSCDKQKQTAKKLKGEWEILTYKFTNAEGLSEIASCEGSMIFESKPTYTDPNPYSLKFSYDFSTSSGIVDQVGTFDVIESGDYLEITKTDASGTVLSTDKYRILTRTSTDLQLEYSDSIGCIHMYIFERKK